ncbi:DUF1896 family protein [Tenacibaculum piscium]|uniref:DUF1896 family protein n=1 Tax=Tenacibaculum piscium TaxID=1458515 RepID=UPI001F2E9475|nr:DUF1896 family protein [Tenacibaculum piscium]
METTTERRDLSYFQLRLQEFLNQSYPELAKDQESITVKGNLATEMYADAIKSGNNHLEASYEANEVLFSDLPFSKMDMLFNVVCEEFNRDIPDNELRSFTEKMYPICQSIFSQYKLDKDFEDDEMYASLYTELTGTIQLWMDEHLVI